MISKIVTLGDVCNKGSSNIAQKDLVDRDGIYPIYGAAGYIKNVDFAHQDKPYLAVVKDGAGIGRVMKLPANSSIIGTMQYILPKGNIDIDYLYFALQYMNLSKYFSGSTIPHIYFRDYQKEKLPLPELSEQQGKAYVLLRIEQLIECYHQQLTKLDELVKSRFIELFVDKDFPKTTIGELVASKVSSVKKVFLPTDTIKYIDISSIDNKRNIMTGFTEYVLEDAPSRAQQHIRKGDIVVSTVRPNLKNVAITGYDYDNLVASSGFCVLRAEKCLPSYLMAVVCSDDFTDAMTKVVTGANYPAIKDSDVKNYVVPNPPVELQEQFAAFVEQTDKSKLAIQESLAELETLKKALMQKYFG